APCAGRRRLRVQHPGLDRPLENSGQPPPQPVRPCVAALLYRRVDDPAGLTGHLDVVWPLHAGPVGCCHTDRGNLAARRRPVALAEWVARCKRELPALAYFSDLSALCDS